jgi:acetyl-CoA carboxylase biotin carboxyl carrier protein
MFKLNEIRDLIKLIDQTSIHEITIENENGKLSIKKPEPAETTTVVAAPPVSVLPAAPQIAVSPQVAPTYVDPNFQQPVSPAVQASPPATIAPAVEEDANLHKIVSPMVGTFYRKPSPDKPNYVEVGDRVTLEKNVCIVEAMKLMNEIAAEVNGEVVKVLVEDGQLVEFGQPLFLVKKDA